MGGNLGSTIRHELDCGGHRRMIVFKLLGDAAHTLAHVQTAIQYAVFMNGRFDKEVRSSLVRDLADRIQGVADDLSRGAVCLTSGETGGNGGTRGPNHRRRRERAKANRRSPARGG